MSEVRDSTAQSIGENGANRISSSPYRTAISMAVHWRRSPRLCAPKCGIGPNLIGHSSSAEASQS
eukprot:5468106-Pyramimonas_sp.AAC.1